MTFKKLALASAIALVPVTGFSLEALDDSTLGTVTGQDGIEIDITTPSPITASFYIHDKDGLTGTVSPTYSFDGGIVINNFSFNGAVNIDIDAGDNTQAGSPSAATLNVNISIPTATIITGTLHVGNSQRDNAASGWGVTSLSAALLNTMTIAMSGLTLNVQLGNEPQSSMIRLTSSVTNGLSINSFALNDAGGAFSGGAIGSANMLMIDNGGTNLSLDLAMDATTSGLRIDVNNIGSVATGMDIRITDQYLGTTGAGIIGDITVVGLNLANSIITISGK